MKINKLSQRLQKNRPMDIVSIRVPVDVINDLKRIALIIGFSGYKALIKTYIGQGLRLDLERLEMVLDSTECDLTQIQFHQRELFMKDVPSVQFITRDGEPEWAVLPYDYYLSLVNRAEMLEAISKSQAQEAVNGIRNQASIAGIDNLSAKQIDEIIQHSRAERKKKDSA